MTNGGEIDENNAAVRLLQGDSCVDGSGGSAGSALGVEKSEHARLAGAALGAAQGCGKAGKGFHQGFAAGGIIEEFTGSGTHGGDNIHGLAQFADRKNGDVRNAAMYQFDGADGSLRVLGIDDHEGNLNALVLHLPQDCIAWAGGRTDVTLHRARQVRAVDSTG